MSLFVDIKKRIGNFRLEVSFEAEGISGILGESGSGKSMTLMCIAGVVIPDSGKIILNDRVLFDSERHINLPVQKRRVGYLFQNYALFPGMTVRQNVFCGFREKKQKKQKEILFREIVERMQLMGLEKHLPGQLSGGQQQRVALARILVGNPELLMLDEPFSALDSHLRSQLQHEMMQFLNLFSKDALIVTHDFSDVYLLCNSIIMLDLGRILISKGTKQFFCDPESRKAALLSGCKNVVCAKKIGKYEVFVADWGVSFTASQPVRDTLCAIGIRSHYLNPEASMNQFPICYVGEMETPFEIIIYCRSEKQKDDSVIWWSTLKGKGFNHFPGELGVESNNIMLLYY